MYLLFAFLCCSWYNAAQIIPLIKNESVIGIKLNNKLISFHDRPIISYELNQEYTESTASDKRIAVIWSDSSGHYFVTLRNNSMDTLSIKNVVPLGTHSDEAMITGKGDHPLSRTYLFIPGKSPVNVIVPDDAWNLGYTSIQIDESLHAYALTKRSYWNNAIRKRFETILNPDGEVTYEFHMDTFSGVWQNGLRACFQFHKLYDRESFDDGIYHRKDLQWIKQAKMMHLIMAWDNRLYNRTTGKYELNKFIKKSKLLYGGDDVIGIWPTWPALGMDQRNQWDMYRDLPGGWKGLHVMVEDAHKQGVKIFISYNPWDESTRMEDHLSGMAALIKSLDADGVILDTRGASSKEMQAAVDLVKPGVIMYSEGMAVPKDMESIIAGRVHNALYYPPILNLNKLIKPDFGIYRVAEVFKEPIRREIHSALFNGYGIEFNVFHPGDPTWLNDQYLYLGKALRILREHTTNFNGSSWQPLVPSLKDSVWINYWPGDNKDIYTIYNFIPKGHQGKLFRLKNYPNASHCIDLWNHTDIIPDPNQIVTIPLKSYPSKDLGTNNEGSMGVVAVFDSILTVKPLLEKEYTISAIKGTHILIWPDDPNYSTTPIKRSISNQHIDLNKLFPKPISKAIVQVFDGTELIDERILFFNQIYKSKTDKSIKLYHASDKVKPIRSTLASNKVKNFDSMVRIPPGNFVWNTSHGDEFIPYPDNGHSEKLYIQSFYIDKHPVTNEAFYKFIKASHYVPFDTTNFLKHWINGTIPTGLEKYPVIFVSQEDAEAYCRWSGKRLPTETEWQYAAQTSKMNEWPWGNDAGIRRTDKEVVTETLTHIQYDTFDSTRANPGNGRLDQVAHYPEGKNIYDMTDLVGSVWQMTSDQYSVGSFRYSILKGGSYYKPTSSWWYVQGGPRPLTWRQMWLRVSEGFERSATIGFRCVK